MKRLMETYFRDDTSTRQPLENHSGPLEAFYMELIRDEFMRTEDQMYVHEAVALARFTEAVA